MKGLGITMVMLYHYSQLIYTFHPRILNLGLGTLGCSIFFFLSGYALYLSESRMHGAKINIFFGKRMAKLFLPLVLNNIICVILLSINVLPPPPPSELSRYAYFNLNNISTVFYNIIGLRPINPFDWFLRVLILLNIASIISFRLKITPAYLCVIVGVLYTLHTRSVNSVSWISFIAGYLYSANKPKLYMYVLTCIALISYFIFVRCLVLKNLD